ncbi:uncharacterized protein N7459_004879 [Penicillium hispanicum]|uniref:uncharacterized protein n=1 Tax=Penicillium hispanicum TaxID=1080232 RepID=UPI002541A30A|nr:uncharacterized protein N7459_004879 [Penicillium hispanicum]KAJ5585079.1 hypothetical protein N7459_004879 [Penicillium hispanicum]
MADPGNNFAPYTPVTSVPIEIGIMIAFVGAFFLTMGVYSWIWRAVQRRHLAQDLAHRKAFHSRTAPGLEMRAQLGATATVSAGGAAAGPVHEKMLDRYAMPEDRAELPVHGMEDRVLVGGGEFVMMGPSSGKSQGLRKGPRADPL